MKEVIDRYELVEGTRIQTTTDLNVVTSQQSHCCPVLLLKYLPLQRRAEQQEVVICTEQERERRGGVKIMRRSRFKVRTDVKRRE